MENEQKELKMWLVVRGDLDIPKGKLAAQAGHGFCTAMYQLMQTKPEVVVEYFEQNQPKITVVAKNLAALERVYSECFDALLPVSFIKDEGRTVFSEPTVTVVGIGPCYRDELPKYVQRLQIMKD